MLSFLGYLHIKNNLMTIPIPTRIYRIIHIANLKTILDRECLYAPTEEPNDGKIYKTIHNAEIQKKRHTKLISCGPKGCLHDYVPFYLGYHSPMLLQLHTGRVKDHREGQKPIIYLVAHAPDFLENEFVFSDGHAIHHLTKWYDNLKDLDKIDWKVVQDKFWNDSDDDNDRQRRKQAEFLIYKICKWSYIRGIIVLCKSTEEKVLDILKLYPQDLQKPVKIMKEWYY